MKHSITKDGTHIWKQIGDAAHVGGVIVEDAISLVGDEPYCEDGVGFAIDFTPEDIGLLEELIKQLKDLEENLAEDAEDAEAIGHDDHLVEMAREERAERE